MHHHMDISPFCLLWPTHPLFGDLVVVGVALVVLASGKTILPITNQRKRAVTL